MRFYKLNDDGTVQFQKSIRTASQARKASGLIVASITSKLSSYPNEHLVKWRESGLVDLAHMLPEATYEKLSHLVWGIATCLKTGETIPVSEFGTNVHAAIESRLNSLRDTGEPTIDASSSAYFSHSQGFIDYVQENNIEVLQTEYAIGCDKLLVAATADFIGKLDGKVALWDFKCRSGKTLLKNRAYEKDCMQLAVTAKMVEEQWKLEYTPRIFTVPVDRISGETYVKCWTERAQAKALRLFIKFNDWYNGAKPVTEEDFNI